MAAYQKNPSGIWRAIARRNGISTSRFFRLKSDAVDWATETEYNISHGRQTNTASRRRTLTLFQLSDLHIIDMCEVARPGAAKIIVSKN
jgi:hypothetical protein